tara:strand:+ start:39 stop:194 length:156 start_codon:yes stop_codon:yes gene_type:complete
MIETKVRKIMDGFVDCALVIKHEVKLEDQSLESCEFFVIKSGGQLLGVIYL